MVLRLPANGEHCAVQEGTPIEAFTVMRCPTAGFETCTDLTGPCMQRTDRLLHAGQTASTPQSGHHGAKEGSEASKETMDLYAWVDCVGRGHPASQALRYV